MTLRIGHRGAGGTHPENTLISFARAVELRCDAIEFDVHRTSDGHLIVIHDPTLNRTTNGSGLVREHTLADIKQLDAGRWKDAAYAEERVPTLAEVIHQTPASVQLFVELKAGSIHYPGIEAELVEALRREGVVERTQVSSFDHHALKLINELAPEIELGMLIADNPVDPVAMAKACGATAINPFYLWVSPQMVMAARAAGMKVNVWNVNDPVPIALLKQLGVDGVMSDYPDRL
jgi:glycerophosphoryl diester phosphodiesterase